MTGETDSGITFGATIRADNAVGRPGRHRTARPTAASSCRALRHPDLRRHQRRRRAVGRRRPGRLLADRPRRPRRDAVHLERRRLRQRQRQQLRQQPVRASDDPLRLRHHRLRHVAVVEPRPDRHRRRRRLRGRLRRRQPGASASATTSSTASISSATPAPARSTSATATVDPVTGDCDGVIDVLVPVVRRPRRPGRRAVVGRPERRLRGLRLRPDLHQARLRHRRRRRVRRRQPADRRLVRLRRLRRSAPYYGKILNAEGDARGPRRRRLLRLSAQYDLGGGASINGGVRRTYDLIGLGGDEADDSAWIADFGIKMAF